jgi:hypothetical protein
MGNSVVTETFLPNRWLAMGFRSGSAIPAFRRHITIYFILMVYLTELCSFDSVASTRRMMVNSELERLWKEAIAA